MKRSFNIAIAAVVALAATPVLATNGDNLIALGAKSRGMGGTGIGISHGAETGLSNPALINTVKGTEVSFGGTIFMPDVESNLGSGAIKSEAKLSAIPEVAIAQKVSDNFHWGIGMFGTAGMGVDYRDAAGGGNFNMVTNLSLMQFAVPLSYTMNNLSLAIAPVLQYGALDINYNNGSNIGSGIGQDFGSGFNFGVAYTMDALKLGAMYKSAIDMNYHQVLTTAANGFGLTSITNNLEQPAEYGAGASYVMDVHTFAFDYKLINWASAKGYKDFAWKDQSVMALGYAYDGGNWTARLGYNYAKSPIEENTNPAIDAFNLVGFPATVETHITVGGAYEFSEQTSLDLAYVYSPKIEKTLDATGLPGGITNVTTGHSQQALSAQVNFAF